MKFRWNPKYLYAGITAFLVIVASILFYLLLNRMDVVLDTINFLTAIIMPFLIGFVTAYLLNPIMEFFEKRCFGPIISRTKWKVHPKLARVFALIVTFILAFAVVAALGFMVFPQLFESISGIIGNLSTYFARIEKWILGFASENQEIVDMLETQFDNISKTVTNWATNDLLPQLTNLAGGLTVGLIGLVQTVVNICVGVIVSVYILFSKEKFFAQTKKTCYAIFSIKATNQMLRVTRRADRVFGSFIKGKLIEAVIVWGVMFLGMSVFNMPFAMLISVIVAVTNIIPFFGPFIGVIPSAVLILVVNPMTALYFVIFAFIILQIDANFVGPKVVGGSTGLSAFWVIFSIMVFGGFFGLGGMIIGVPLFALIYSLAAEVAKNRLTQRDMPVSTTVYESIDHIAPDEKVIYWPSSGIPEDGAPEPPMEKATKE